MGCGNSIDIEVLNQERAARESEKNEFEQRIMNIEQMKYEQVEVLVQMLGIEESKQVTLTKRIEALKWAMLSQGWSEKSMDNMIASLRSSTNGSDEQVKLIAAIDLNNSISALSEVIKTSPDEFVRSFADADGRVVPMLSRKDFVKKVIQCSNGNIGEYDAQVLSLRFFDGMMVSIPEFLDFFLSPPELRRARAATNAVRSSINLLQIEESKDAEENIDAVETSTNANTFANKTSHKMVSLDRAIYKLTKIWKYVEDPLRDRFTKVEGGSKIITVEIFEDTIKEVCSRGSLHIPDTERLANPNLGLSASDVELIVDRFEVAERVDWHVFLAFFEERTANKNSNKFSYATSPFQLSTEWAALKKDAKIGKEENITDEDIASLPAPKETPSEASVPIKAAPSEETKEKSPSEKPAESTTVATVDTEVPVPRPESSRSPDLPRSKLSKRLEKQSSFKPKNTNAEVVDVILTKYRENPEQFETIMKNMSELPSIRDNFTRALLSEKLREICNDCSEEEARDFCTKVDFKDNKCSVLDVIVTLRALILPADCPEGGVPESKDEVSGETDPGNDAQQAESKHVEAAEVDVLPRKSTPIGDDFHKLVKLRSADPAAFDQPFKKDELPMWMREHMPNMDAAATERLLNSPEVIAGFAGGDTIPSDVFLDRLRIEAVALVGPDHGSPHEEEQAKAEPKKAEDTNPFSFFCCGGSASTVHDPSSKPADVDAKADDKDAKDGGVDDKGADDKGADDKGADDKGADEKASDTKSVEGSSRRVRGMGSELDEKAGRSEGSDNGSKRSVRADEEDTKPVRNSGSRTSSLRSIPPVDDPEKKRFSSPKLPNLGSLRNMMSPSESKDTKPKIVY